MSIESRSNQYGNVFDGWQITKKLGRGSNGKTAVYQLTRKDDDWEETCALKVITLIEEKGVYEELSPSRQEEYKKALKQRISDAKQEVRLMEKLRGNTNIVDYLDHKPKTWKKVNSFGCDMMIRMELLHDLRSEIASGRIFTEAEIIKIGKDICNALILCHSKGILHRDIKPENIFFNDDGNYKLGDFGVSRILDACPDATASTGIGTYEYWPAEQMTGRYDKRVDIYSLGLVLYELSNRNRLPFAASTYLTGSEVPMRLAGKPLPAPSEASSALAQVILKACAFKPEERYQSAEEFLKALNRLTSSVQNTAPYQVASQPLKQVQTHDDYTTALAKELGLPEDIFADDTYKTAPAEANELPPKTSFATRSAGQTQNSYQTAPAEQNYTKSKKKYTKGKRTATIVLSVIALCLMILIGTMVGTLLFKSDGNELESVLMENTNFTTSTSTEGNIFTEDLFHADTGKIFAEETTTVEITVPPTESVEMKTVYLRTTLTDEYNNIYYEYNDDGTLYRFGNRASSNETVNYYIYDDGSLISKIEVVNTGNATQADRDAIIDEINTILDYPTDSNIQYRIMVFDANDCPVRLTVVDSELSILFEEYTTYDNQYNRIKTDIYYSDSQIGETHITYQYDVSGHLIRRERYDTGSNTTTSYEFTYDTGGKIKEEKISGVYWKYIYDAKGLLVKREQYNDEQSATGVYYEYIYDDFGNVIQGISKSSVDNNFGANFYYSYKVIQVPVTQLEHLKTIYENGIGFLPLNIVDDTEKILN